MNEILVIDKPGGMTSHGVVQKVKRALRAGKVGHAGTLDPMATGVLVVGIDRGTKRLGTIADGPKIYQAVIALGARTGTGDREGALLEEREVPRLTRKSVEAVLRSCEGDQVQIPPKFSAIKVRGKPLYRWARRGIEVPIPPRQVTIDKIELTGFEDRAISVQVYCSKGTYIRTLGEEIAKRLGTLGYLASLRRTACGPYTIEQAIPLYKIETGMLVFESHGDGFREAGND